MRLWIAILLAMVSGGVCGGVVALGFSLGNPRAPQGVFVKASLATGQSAPASLAAVSHGQLADTLGSEAPKQNRWNWDARISQHEKSPRVGAWSVDAAKAIDDDLALLRSRVEFSADKADCRANTCLVRTTWPSYAEARARHQVLLHYAYRTNCTRTIVMPARAGSELDPVVLTMLFEC